MKYLLFLVWMATAAIAYPGEVFRYNDDLTKQSHYMEGEPGTGVSGGWTFESPEGNEYALSYKADDLGFQPEANYLPVQVEDTEDVANAKVLFYSAFDEEKARNQVEDKEVEEEVEAEDARIRREEEAETVTEEAVNAETEDKTENPGSFFYLNQANNLLPKEKLVFHPYYGYIPLNAKQNVEKKVYGYHPYKGYVQMKEDEIEGPKYEFNPYYGFVPVPLEPKVDKMMPEEKKKKAEQMVYHPYFGFISVEKLKEQENQQYAFDPYYGYIPVKSLMAKSKTESPAVEKEEEKPAEKYVLHPMYGFVEESKLKNEKMRVGVNFDMKYVFNPYYGFVPEKMDNKNYAFDPLTGLQVPQPLVKAEGEGEEEAPQEVEVDVSKEEKGAFVYHPIYGFVPESKATEMNLLKDTMKRKFILDPFYGFVPQPVQKATNPAVEKMMSMTEEMPAERRKRSAQFVYPSYQYPVLPPLLYSNPNLPISKSDFTVPASTNLLASVTPYKFELPPTVIQSEVPKPIYYIPQTIPVQRQVVEEKPAETSEVPAEQQPDVEATFPSVLPGAAVAQEALPEKDFPVFPYDPDQDAPAALAF